MRSLHVPFAALCVSVAIACTAPARDSATKPGEGSPYLLVSAGDRGQEDSDFLAVVDLRSDSPDLGKVIATTPTGLKSSMPHHMEYVMPPAGELLFMNAHHHEHSLLVDVSDPRAPRIAKTFRPPPPFRYPHDYSRTPTGTRLVGFLRSEGKSIGAGFGPRVLRDGSVFFNSYGCAFYRLSEIRSEHPRLDTFFALDTPPPSTPDDIRGSCGIPIPKLSTHTGSRAIRSPLDLCLAPSLVAKTACSMQKGSRRRE